MQFWCLIHFKFFVYRHHVPTKIARPECVDNRLAAASYGSTSSELGTVGRATLYLELGLY